MTAHASFPIRVIGETPPVSFQARRGNSRGFGLAFPFPSAAPVRQGHGTLRPAGGTRPPWFRLLSIQSAALSSSLRPAGGIHAPLRFRQARGSALTRRCPVVSRQVDQSGRLRPQPGENGRNEFADGRNGCQPVVLSIRQCVHVFLSRLHALKLGDGDFRERTKTQPGERNVAR